MSLSVERSITLRRGVRLWRVAAFSRSSVFHRSFIPSPVTRRNRQRPGRCNAVSRSRRARVPFGARQLVDLRRDHGGRPAESPASQSYADQIVLEPGMPSHRRAAPRPPRSGRPHALGPVPRPEVRASSAPRSARGGRAAPARVAVPGQVHQVEGPLEPAGHLERFTSRVLPGFALVRASAPSDERVDQRGLADVRAADERDLGRAVVGEALRAARRCLTNSASMRTDQNATG